MFYLTKISHSQSPTLSSRHPLLLPRVPNPARMFPTWDWSAKQDVPAGAAAWRNDTGRTKDGVVTDAEILTEKVITVVGLVSSIGCS